MPWRTSWKLLLFLSVLSPLTYAQDVPDSLSTVKSTLPPGWQDEWTPSTFPNPQMQPLDCRRGRQRSWVCDPNMVLSKGAADDVDNLLKSNRSEKCHCEPEVCATIDGYGGIQGSVAIIQKMYFRASHPSGEAKQKAAEAFADELRNDFWKFGLCEDDYVIFISKEDRQVFTSSGGKARTVLTDRCVSEVFDKIRPQLTNDDYASALKTMVEDYILVGQKKHACNTPRSAGHIIGGVFGGVIALIICCACCAYCQNRREKKKSSYSTETRSPIYKPAPTTEPPREECIQPPPRESPDNDRRSSLRNSPKGSHHGGSHEDVRKEPGARGSKESVASKQSGGGGGGF